MIQMGKRGVREAAIGATAAQKLAHRNTHLRMLGVVLIQCKRAQCFERYRDQRIGFSAFAFANAVSFRVDVILMADSVVAGKCARERAFVHGESAHNISGKIVAAEYCDANLVFKAFSRDAAASERAAPSTPAVALHPVARRRIARAALHCWCPRGGAGVHEGHVVHQHIHFSDQKLRILEDGRCSAASIVVRTMGKPALGSILAAALLPIFAHFGLQRTAGCARVGGPWCGTGWRLVCVRRWQHRGTDGQAVANPARYGRSVRCTRARA